MQESCINTQKSGVKNRRKPIPKIVHFWGPHQSAPIPDFGVQIRNSLTWESCTEQAVLSHMLLHMAFLSAARFAT